MQLTFITLDEFCLTSKMVVVVTVKLNERDQSHFFQIYGSPWHWQWIRTKHEEFTPLSWRSVKSFLPWLKNRMQMDHLWSYCEYFENKQAAVYSVAKVNVLLSIYSSGFWQVHHLPISNLSGRWKVRVIKVIATLHQNCSWVRLELELFPVS